jgi:peroxiredoxin
VQTLSRLRAGWARAMKRRWLRWTVDLALIGAVVLAVMTWQTRNLIGRGEPAPPFELRDLDGQLWRLEDLRGKPVMIAFWAPWCGVCKTESPTVSRVQRQVGQGAHVISIALGWDDVEQVRRYVREQKVDYPVLLGDDRVSRQWNIGAFPTVYFVSGEGKIRSSTVGLTTTLGMRLRLGK